MMSISLAGLMLLASGCGKPDVDPISSDVSEGATQSSAPATEQSTTEIDSNHENVAGVASSGFDELPADIVPPSTASDAPAALISSGKRLPTTARELVEIRAEMDRTVWKDEVEAQRYERTFVSLWDRLIFEADKYAVLQAFPFSELLIGSSMQSEPTDLGIQIHRFDGEPRSIAFEQWPAFLEQFRGNGFEIVETEWHHQRFEPPTANSPAKSVVSTLIHVSHPTSNRRFVLKGNLRIVWATELREEQSSTTGERRLIAARPASIDATEIEIFERAGAPAFATDSMLEFACDATGRTAPTTIHPVILHDLNQDGLPEVILGGFNLVLWNEGNFKFRREALCTHPPGHVNAGVLADFDGDGITDYLCGVKNGFPKLYRGQPKGVFTDPPTELVIAKERLRSPTGLTAGDIDGDGDLDLFIGQQKPGYTNGDIPTPYFDANDSFPSYLLLNDGKGQFHDVINEVGLSEKSRRRNYSVSFVDLDDDGDLDLLMASDFSGADLFFNDGQGHFTDVSDRLEPRGYAFGMSHTFGDYDLNGTLDFMLIGMSSTTARRLEQLGLRRTDFDDYDKARPQMGYGNRMYLSGESGFVQAPFNDTVARTGWSWGSTTLDFDRDGDQDIYVVNGQYSGKTTQDYCTRFWCHDIYYKEGERPDEAVRELFSQLEPIFSGGGVSWNGYEHNALLMNVSGQKFINVGYLMGVGFEMDCRCVVSGDLDQDGAIDLIVEQNELQTGKANLYFCRNQWSDTNQWIGVHLRAKTPGISALGAQVRVELNDGSTLLQQNVSGHSVWAQHADTVHFGLGARTSVTRLVVRWPDGQTTELADPTVNQYHVVER